MERIVQLESEIAELRKNLHEKENELYELKKTCVVVCVTFKHCR